MWYENHEGESGQRLGRPEAIRYRSDYRELSSVDEAKDTYMRRLPPSLVRVRYH